MIKDLKERAHTHIHTHTPTHTSFVMNVPQYKVMIEVQTLIMELSYGGIE